MSERRFIRPQHDVIARVLRALRTDFVLGCECWFGGGTAIVMRNGEYRLSLDVDFLCSSRAGYARMRAAVVAEGPSALFDDPVGSKFRPKMFRRKISGIRKTIAHARVS